MARYRIRRKHTSLIVVIIALVLWAGQQYGWFGGAKQMAETSQPGLYTVNHFIDGDTIAVDMNGKVEDIRFIGVDTPETHKPNTPVQCYGPAAAAYTKNLISGSKVRLSLDPESTNRDRYNRLLRYVYLPDGTLVNEKIIENGYGFYYPYFPFTKSAEFQKAEQKAMSQNIGLWGNCHPTPTDDGGYKMTESAPKA